MEDIVYKPIGTIRSPYRPGGFCPRQPLEREDGESRIELFPEYETALQDLARFSHLYVLFHQNESRGEWEPEVCPPWAEGKRTGLFASRSPRRPNPIGLSIVRLRRIEGATLITDLLDAYDGTPVLDLKPYIQGLDSRPEANNGWISDLKDHNHRLQHLRGLPHGHHDHHHHNEHHDHHGHHDHHKHNDHD